MSIRNRLRRRPGQTGFKVNRLGSPYKAFLLVLTLAITGYTAIQFSSAATDPQPMPALSTELKARDEAEAETESQIMVRYKPGINVGVLDNTIDAINATEEDEINNLRIKVLKVPPGQRQKIMERLRSDPQVEFAEPDSVITDSFTKPNDPDYALQDFWPKTLTDIAWDKTKGSPITIAVIDSGIDAAHPEFAGKILPGIDYANNDAIPEEDSGHGTAVSGIIAALSNNSIGIAGGCWNCKILPVKVTANGSGNSSNLAKGIQYAADNGAKVINISNNGPANVSAVDTAIDYAAGKGVIIVVSAGNSGKQEVLLPTFNQNTIAVAATDLTDTITTYSTFGSHIDIAAPGKTRTTSFPSKYVTEDGTSLSAPLVTSIVGLMRSAYPNATAAQIRTALLQTADLCCGGKIGGGRVNAARALSYLAGNGAADTVKPAVSFTTPAQGATVSGNPYRITGTATDNTAVSKVVLHVDGQLAFSSTTAAVNVTWNTLNFTDGSHTLTLTPYDQAGNIGPAASRTVTVNNANPTPTPSPTPTPNPQPADLNGDGRIGLTDLSILLSNYNKTGVPAASGDLNGSGKVDLADMSQMLTAWTK